MSKINGCPYISSSSGQCSHKKCKAIRNRNKYCGYKNAHNCKLFMQWIDKKNKVEISRRNTHENDIGVQQ